MAAPPPSISTYRGQILFVEDEPTLQMFIESVLVSRGYRVISASDGLEALDQFNEHGRTLSAVLTDLHIPRLNGLELVRAIRARDPDIPIVIASGFLSQESVDEFRGLNVAAFLQKPCPVGRLLRTISNVIGRPKTSGPAQ